MPDDSGGDTDDASGDGGDDAVADSDLDDASGDGGDDAGGEDAVCCWLVERDYTHESLLTLVYATPDGERAVTMQRSANMLARTGVTAARDVDPDLLEPVTDPDTRDRYAHEVARTRDTHDPDDAI